MQAKSHSEGKIFAKFIRITMSYENCATPPHNSTERVAAAYRKKLPHKISPAKRALVVQSFATTV